MGRIPTSAELTAAMCGQGPLPMSTRFVERLGTPKGVALASLLSMKDSIVSVDDDFLEDTISSTRWNLAADGTATTYAWAAARSGTIQGATGTTDDGYHAINGDVLWYGDANCGMAVRMKWDVVTSFTFEIGFTDALADETLPAVTDVDTPATGNGATDVAVIHLDTDQTLATAAFVGESTGSVFACQKVNLGTFVPTAATYYTFVVGLVGNTGMCAIWNTNDPSNPVLQASTNKSLTSLLEGGTAVRPHIMSGTRNITSKVTDIDRIVVWQDR